MVLKNINRLSILNYIRRHKFTTKAAIATESGLTFMAIQKIIEELLAHGLVRQDAYEGGRLGRKALTYTIDENYGYTIGLHINMFETRVGLLNLNGEILLHKSLNMTGLSEDSSVFIDSITTMVNALITEKGIDKSKLLGLGIGVPGPVNTAEGRIMSPPNMKMLRYMPLRQIMEQKTGLPVLLHKDTNAIAMGEYWRGVGASYSDMVYIDADMGIGSGLILSGVLHEGANSIAGEFGHITIDPHGPLCNCGSQGCLEAMGSGISILKEFKSRLAERPGHPLASCAETLTIQQVLNAGASGDPLAVSILNEAAYNMGSAIRNLINILDPEIIILGGILTLQYEPYFTIVKETTLHKRLAGSRENLLVPTTNADHAGMIGAGELVADHFFSTLVNEILLKD
ncbi:serine/threonine protein kinase [Spirochaetia bacterium]|nr:serine/threonine protein kinase [Spirochaetia bacterium]